MPRIDFGSYFSAAGAPTSQRIACRVSITADGPIGTLILRIVDASGRSPPTPPTVKYSFLFVGITTSGAVREFIFTMEPTPNWTAIGFWLDVQDAPAAVQFTSTTFTAEFRDWVPATTKWQTYDVPPSPRFAKSQHLEARDLPHTMSASASTTTVRITLRGKSGQLTARYLTPAGLQMGDGVSRGSTRLWGCPPAAS